MGQGCSERPMPKAYELVNFKTLHMRREGLMPQLWYYLGTPQHDCQYAIPPYRHIRGSDTRDVIYETNDHLNTAWNVIAY